ncbi:MAG: hypothetical protein CL678_16780 [Bdellovibrionaceae bacterium]|nr:hypothetical protein [Pseudobdellovibrionaceae bacterium]|tara:strand:- start:5473 stop:6054 length:582 start_codon:yes stop_codon:yes gene_type:complete
MTLILGSIWSKKNNIIKTTYNQIKIRSQPKKPNALKISSSEKKHTRAYWGNATWILFHTIAAKINDDYYKKNYKFVWDFIKRCCSELPCPYCRTHAMAYIKTINIRQVITRSQLERVLFDFHNTANKHANNPQFAWSNISKYKKSHTKNVFINFENKFFRTFYNSREFSQWLRNSFKKDFYIFRNAVFRHMNT